MKRMLTVLTLCLLIPLSSSAEDDDDEREEHHASRSNAAVLHQAPQWKAYASECGTCHLAFSPSMLPARSWRALLAGLKDHFGENAEVDGALGKQLEAFLVQNAGAEVRGPTPLRITAPGPASPPAAPRPRRCCGRGSSSCCWARW